MQKEEVKRSVCAKCGHETTCYLKANFYFCFKCLQKTTKVKSPQKKGKERKVGIFKPIC